MTQNRSDTGAIIPASVILQELHEEAPAGQITLDWLTSSLHKQSFGLIMLVLAIAAAAPGICMVAGPLLLIPAFQMIIGRHAPLFPRWIAARPLPTQHLGAVVQRAIPMLRYLERTIYPRCPTPPEMTKRFVGIAVMLLSARLVLTPIPFSNIVPALLIGLISLAYLEEDGFVLSIGLLMGLVVLAVDLGVVWELFHGAKLIRLPV